MKLLRWGMLGVAAAGLVSAPASARQPDCNTPIAPFRIIGNITEVLP